MPLKSRLFQGDVKLEACLVKDAAHIVLGSSGDHVAKIQTAVSRLEGYSINFSEIQQMLYGTSTAKAILDYKVKRNIINRSYQTKADNIVGKMTIESLDKEIAMLERQVHHKTKGLLSAT